MALPVQGVGVCAPFQPVRSFPALEDVSVVVAVELVVFCSAEQLVVALADGVVTFEKFRKDRKKVSVLPASN